MEIPALRPIKTKKYSIPEPIRQKSEIGIQVALENLSLSLAPRPVSLFGDICLTTKAQKDYGCHMSGLRYFF